MTGKVYLVGAGCGSADLITLRGKALLQQCEVLIYDDLIAPELLNLAPGEAERIYMGKRSGRHSAGEEEICAQLIEKAREGKMVVRLKGGDPFVFGRGGEEMLALQKAGIPCAAVPGITSAVAIPAQAGIPVTQRGVSRSFHVITAHTRAGEDTLNDELAHYAQLSGTLVFLMGLSRIEEIARGLIDCGRGEETPAAVISGGNAENPCTVRGTLRDIAARTREAGVTAPAVIVVGETAGMALAATLPLSGVTVALMGTEEIRKKLAPALTAQGADVVTAEYSKTRPCAFSFDLQQLENGENVITFTSSSGVKLFFARLREEKFDLRRLARCRFAVIGRATGETLASYGIFPDICPAVFTSAALADALFAETGEDARIFLFRSRQGSPVLVEKLAGRRAVEDVPLYDIVCDEESSLRAGGYLARADYLIFASASGVEHFFAVHGAVPARTKCVCIGAVTGAALRKMYKAPFFTAREASAESMVETILAAQGK